MFHQPEFLRELTVEMVADFLAGKADAEDRFIIEKLKNHELNQGKINPEVTVLSSDDFKPVDILLANQLSVQPAGCIYSIHRAFTCGDTHPDPYAVIPFVYVLTNPEPRHMEDLDPELISKYPEYFTVLALPVSFQTQYATPADLIIPEDNQWLASSFMVQTGAQVSLPIGLLHQNYGKLPSELSYQIIELIMASSGFKPKQDILDHALTGTNPAGEYDVQEFLLAQEDNIQALSEPVLALEEYLFQEFSPQVEIRILGTLSSATRHDEVSLRDLFELPLAASDTDEQAKLVKFLELESAAGIRTTIYRDPNTELYITAVNRDYYLLLTAQNPVTITNFALLKGNDCILQTPGEFVLRAGEVKVLKLALTGVKPGSYIFTFSIGGVAVRKVVAVSYGEEE